jgi:hypothetical protein
MKHLRHTLSTLDMLMKDTRRTLQEGDETFIPVVRAEKQLADAAWASKKMADAALAWKKGLVFHLGLYEHKYGKS